MQSACRCPLVGSMALWDCAATPKEVWVSILLRKGSDLLAIPSAKEKGPEDGRKSPICVGMRDYFFRHLRPWNPSSVRISDVTAQGPASTQTVVFLSGLGKRIPKTN